ncbi:nitrate reductase molybdenum cofactor assembly chaperone [Nocardiopsis potens]|uniref:nitrate reductase molybdenum cofactor assembly chaperone n=1 Tax=Nocardiopsis potens TaxID=1246458 RepID=UPI00034752D0|nr:nitrate reductase molybdenum cofactor assembly chaperone [Nocardiopsis potens]
MSPAPARRRAAAHTAVVRMAAAWCLQYPDAAVRGHLPLLRAALAETGGHRPAALLRPLLEHLERTPPRTAEEHYVTVFDTKPRRSLHLTWYLDGDTRRRGASLARLAGAYRAHGHRTAGGELPDHLPVLLEFSASGDPAAARAGQELLSSFRSALALLHGRLADLDTPYAAGTAAVLATLPQGDRAAAPAEPPPAEAVGLAPYPPASPPRERT